MVAVTSDPGHFNPAITTGYNVHVVADSMFNGLVALDANLSPIITLIGTRIGWVLGGAILVENVFAWPGLGRLIITSSINRDYPMILGIVLVAALLTVTANLVVDLIYNWIDPRIDQRRRIDEH